MPAHFLSIASELRNRIYELLIVHEGVVQPWNRHQDRQFSVGLLLTNKTIYREASSLLYGQNRFDLRTYDSWGIGSFFTQIGNSNTSLIRYVYIKFPRLNARHLNNIVIDDVWVNILTRLRDCCPNLSVLSMMLHSTDNFKTALARSDLGQSTMEATEALMMVDHHLQAIPSLGKVVIEVFEDGSDNLIRSEMERLGWIVHKMQKVERGDPGWNAVDYYKDLQWYFGQYLRGEDYGVD